MSEYVSLRHLPKTLWPYLLDYIPKLKINYVEYEYNEVKIDCHICYMDHLFPLKLMAYITPNLNKYTEKCDTIDKIIKNLKEKIPINRRLHGGFSQNGKCEVDQIIISDSNIQIGLYSYSFDCANVIISLLEYVKVIGIAKKNVEYVSHLYHIYMKSYPNFHIKGFDTKWCENYNDDLKELFKSYQYHGYHKFDFTEYETMCQSGKYKDYFPIYKCNKLDCLINAFNMNPNHDEAIVAMNCERSYCGGPYESTDIKMVYLFSKS